MVIKKYLKIYLMLLRFSLIDIFTYRVNFLMGLVIDFGYQMTLIVFFQVIYGNISEINGWTYYQILVLMGFSLISIQILLATTYVFNIFRLPHKIKTGEFDFVLLKPINSMFTSTLAHIYFTGFIGTISGIFMVFIGLRNLSYQIILTDIVGTGIIFICGLIIGYSIFTTITSLSFRYINTDIMPQISMNIMGFRNNPHTIYSGVTKRILLYILPVVFLASIPADTLINGLGKENLSLAIVMAVISLTVTGFTWKQMLKFYSSASS